LIDWNTIPFGGGKITVVTTMYQNRECWYDNSVDFFVFKGGYEEEK